MPGAGFRSTTCQPRSGEDSETERPAIEREEIYPHSELSGESVGPWNPLSGEDQRIERPAIPHEKLHHIPNRSARREPASVTAGWATDARRTTETIERIDADTAGAVPDAGLRSSTCQPRSGQGSETQRPAIERDEIRPHSDRSGQSPRDQATCDIERETSPNPQPERPARACRRDN